MPRAQSWKKWRRVRDSKGSIGHDAIQVDVYRRLSRGVQLNGNYQYSWAMAS